MKEIQSINEPLLEKVDLKVLDFLKTKCRLQNVLADLQKLHPKVIKNFDLSNKDQLKVSYWKIETDDENWEDVKNEFEGNLPH